MRSWLVHLLVSTVTLIVVAGYFEGFYLSGIGAALIASLLLSIINMVVKPVLVLFTLPVTMMTFGLFLFIINAITLLLTAYLMGDSFVINSFWMALFAAIILSVLNTLIHKLIIDPLRKKK